MDGILKEFVIEMKDLKRVITGLQGDIFSIKTEVVELKKCVMEREINGLESKENIPNTGTNNGNISGLQETGIRLDYGSYRAELTDMSQSINIIGNGISELKKSTRLMWNDIKRMDKGLGKQEVNIRQLLREL